MSQIKLSKKTYLLLHAEKIIELKKKDYTHQQIINYLKKHEHMPFEIDISLFSRHCKSIFEQTNLKQLNQNLVTTLEKDQKYIQQLEQSNRTLLNQLKEKNQQIKQLELSQNNTSEPEVIQGLHNEIEQLKNKPIPEETEQQLLKLIHQQIELKQTIDDLHQELTEQKEVHQEDREKLIQEGQRIINAKIDEIEQLQSQLTHKKTSWLQW